MAKRKKSLIQHERCPVCRNVLNVLNDNNHVERCLQRHRLECCDLCGSLVSLGSMERHIATAHVQHTKSPARDKIDHDAIELPVTQKVSWKLLAHGLDRFQAILHYFEEFNQRQKVNAPFEQQRLYDVYALGADEIYVGKDEFDGYVVFVFVARDMAVLESPFYGNATYIIRGSWRHLSRLTKSKLLSQHTGKVKRIIHKEHWLSNLKALFR